MMTRSAAPMGSSSRAYKKEESASTARRALAMRAVRFNVSFPPLKSGRRVDPQKPSFVLAWILPAMRRHAFEIEAVAGAEFETVSVERNFQVSAQDVNKFLALVRVGLAAARLRRNAKQVRLHDGIAPGEQFHAHPTPGLQNFALRGADQVRV